MIIPSKKLIKFIESFGSNTTVAKNVGIDEATLSKILKGKKNCSSTIMEAFTKFTGWEFDDAFELHNELEEE